MQNTWEENPYHNIIRQRNILIIICIACIISTGILGFYISQLAYNAQKQVYIVQVDYETGDTHLINNTQSNRLFSNDAIALYFIEKYIHARESYSADQSSYSQNLIKLFSSNAVLRQYLGYMYNEKENLKNKYKNNQSYIKIKNKMKYSDNTYLIRFNLYNTNNQQYTKHAAIISIKYTDMHLNEEDLKINPIGLQITEYKVNEEK